MASFFNLQLDTIAPQGVTLKIEDGALYTASANVDLAIGCSDASKTGYTMKIWGIADAVQEEDAKWENFNATKNVNLISGDGLKTVYVKIRDNVWNESTPASATITLNTSIPSVAVVGPDTSIISKVTGKNISTFNFTSDQIFDEYKVGIVESGSSLEGTVTVIPTTGGSVNTSGSANDYPASENIEVKITGADLQTAAGSSDGTYIIKVFVKNKAGTWSK